MFFFIIHCSVQLFLNKICRRPSNTTDVLQFNVTVNNTVVRETGQFSSKGIIYDLIGNLDRIAVLRLIGVGQ